MISYSQGTESAFRYVDTLGMVCPFLAAYGVRYEEKEAVWLAYQQLKQFREFGLLDKSALPCHAYHVVLRKPTGIYGWGRGTAWYFLGLLNTWREMSEGTAEKEDIKQWIYEAAEDYMQYQSQDGGFCTILQGGGQYDSSVTAAMAYFYKWCWKIWNKEVYLRTSERCQQKLKSVTMRDGAVDLCQGDTHGLGTFSQVYDVMPFAQGLLLQAMSE